jgi:hypothetical protein
LHLDETGLDWNEGVLLLVAYNYQSLYMLNTIV